MNCPMCDSAFVGQAGVDMIGLTSWRCLDCGFLWWLTPAPVGDHAATHPPVTTLVGRDSAQAGRDAAPLPRAA